ncbi:MAG TPA: hypothetical protein VFT69_00870 [Pseudolabrys sp.]|nr:hypothetical protein [Pseudolabrys sp.]
MSSLPFEALESFYESVAKALDSIGEANESLFLCRLVLLLASACRPSEALETSIHSAMAGLEDNRMERRVTSQTSLLD